ncbi:MAG: L,D-transpeptidase [Gemmatimonadetes bacterium]|nr:L,D-transpeptidase [Gemmatimonadota bacterium]
MGGGYLIHGTHEYNEDSIGRPVSHGCVRISNAGLRRLYGLVRVGTPVYLY